MTAPSGVSPTVVAFGPTDEASLPSSSVEVPIHGTRVLTVHDDSSPLLMAMTAPGMTSVTVDPRSTAVALVARGVGGDLDLDGVGGGRQGRHFDVAEENGVDVAESGTVEREPAAYRGAGALGDGEQGSAVVEHREANWIRSHLARDEGDGVAGARRDLSLIHISEPTRPY